MIDDEDSKIRRNLVMASSAILVAAWLEIPGSVLLGNLAPSLVNTPQSSFTALGFAIIGYLSYRYRFSEEGATSAKVFKASIEKVRYDRINADISQLHRRYLATKTLPKVLEPLREAYADVAGSVGAKGQPLLYFQHIAPQSYSQAMVTARIDYKATGVLKPDNNVSVTLNWPRSWAISLWLKSHFFGLIYNDVGAQQLAPIVMVFLAEGVLLSRIFI